MRPHTYKEQGVEQGVRALENLFTASG
jgi:hypothetical protein